METASTSARRTALATRTTWDHLEQVPGGEPASHRALGTSAVGFPRSAKSATRSSAVQNPPNDKISIKLIQLSELEKVARKTLLQHNKYHNIVCVIDITILLLYNKNKMHTISAFSCFKFQEYHWQLLSGNDERNGDFCRDLTSMTDVKQDVTNTCETHFDFQVCILRPSLCNYSVLVEGLN